MSRIDSLFPANRVAAAAGFLASLGALIAACQGVFPSAWQNAAVAIAALATKASVVVKYLHGSQQYDRLVTPAPEPNVPHRALTAVEPADTSGGWSPEHALSPQASQATADVAARSAS